MKLRGGLLFKLGGGHSIWREGRKEEAKSRWKEREREGKREGGRYLPEGIKAVSNSFV
jgi:hypothetical protein